MRKTVFLLCITAFLFLFPTVARADHITDRQADELGTQAIEDSLGGTAAEIMDGESIKGGVDAGGVASRMMKTGMGHLSGILKDSILSASMLVFTAMLCSAAGSLIKTGGFGDVDYVTLVGVVSVAALSFGGVRSFVSSAKDVMDEISTFSKLLLPALTAAAAAGGTAASASAKYAAVSIFMDLMISVIGRVIMPFIYAYVAASIASAAFGGDGLSGAANLIKWAATNTLIVIVLVFTVYITISGVVSGTADAATTRLTKTQGSSWAR